MSLSIIDLVDDGGDRPRRLDKKSCFRHSYRARVLLDVLVGVILQAITFLECSTRNNEKKLAQKQD